MQGHRIGYVRVSSFDQNPERQLEQTQVSKVFTDKASGKDTQRPQLEALLTYAKLSWLQAWHIRDETYSAALASWSITSTAMPSLPIGATARPHPRWPALPRGGGVRAPGTSTRSTAASQDGCSTPTSPTSTRRSAHAW